MDPEHLSFDDALAANLWRRLPKDAKKFLQAAGVENGSACLKQDAVALFVQMRAAGITLSHRDLFLLAALSSGQALTSIDTARQQALRQALKQAAPMAVFPEESQMRFYMQQALAQAQMAIQQDEVPVGAVVVYQDAVIAAAHNRTLQQNYIGAHAEMLALQIASQKLGNYRLNDCDLYVTLEPCPMCMGAIIAARIRRLIYAAADDKTGAAGGVVDLAKTRPDRLVVLSGDAELGYSAEYGLALTGDLVLDKAVLDFPESGMPTLDDDVVVVGAKERAKEVPLLLSMAIGLDLNHAFRFSGQGLDVLMDGKLKLEARPQEDLNITGTVNVVSGGYKAYGQNLIIKHGTITFNGPVGNPLLNIRALRRNSPVDAGVEVTGSLEQPRAELISNTPMSDKEKLAWLVLGRALDAQSDDAALATSLGMFLAESVNHQIGLVDDLGVSTRRTRDSVTGEMNPAEQMITVGKHLSGHLYLGYEYGIDSASQAIRLIYQLSRGLQLIARIGTDSSGGEVRYIRRFD